MQLSPLQQIQNIGKHSIGGFPTDQIIRTADVGWLAASICCQLYGSTHATAQVLASILYYPLLDHKEELEKVLGYDPHTDLSHMDKLIVKFCICLAHLHELNFEVIKGNYLCMPALERCQAEMDSLNKEIGAESEKITGAEKDSKRKQYKH